MKTIYRIRDWSHYFENNRTREMKEMSWVPVPNRMDGDGYTELVSHSDGAAHLGAWLAILQIASKCPARGVLMRDGERAHDAHSLARISRLSVEVFETVLPRLVEIGWLEAVPQQDASLSLFVQSDAPQEGAVIPQEGAEAESARANAPQEGAPSRARAERNGTERKGRETHTHVEHNPAPARARDGPEAPAARVGVSQMPQSKFSKETCIAWAEHRAEAGAKISGYAVGRSRWRDGTADDEIEEWLTRAPQQIAEARAAPVNQQMGYVYAEQLVGSLKLAGHDPAPYIAEMDVSEDVRAQLREKFCPQQAIGAG